MEKLFILYKDGGKIIITCKRNGMAIAKWGSVYEPMKNRFAQAYIQRYPKKDNEPVVLVS